METKLLFETRFYSTGWAFRFGLLQFRWNTQKNYRAFSVEWIGPTYLNTPGLTWREFMIARKQQREARKAKRDAASATP